jgi:hypothetical protein
MILKYKYSASWDGGAQELRAASEGIQRVFPGSYGLIENFKTLTLAVLF